MDSNRRMLELDETKLHFPSIKDICLPHFPPPKVDIFDDLDLNNLKLFSDKQIASIENAMKDLPNGMYRETKRLGRLKYRIIKHGDAYFAVYKGKSQDKTLGFGKFGAVKLAQNLNTGEWFALKVQGNNSRIERELDYLKEAGQLVQSGKNEFVQFKRVSYHKDKEQHYMLLKLDGPDLFDFLCNAENNNNNYPPVIYLEAIVKLLKAIEEIHQKNIIHRDLKLENILFDYFSREIMLIDYNFAGKTGPQGNRYSHNIMGTKKYIAPELMKSKDKLKCYNCATDIYALGLTLALFLNLVEVKENDEIGSFYKEDDEIFVENERLPAKLEDKIRILDFIKSMMSDDPDERPNASQAVLLFEKVLSGLDIQKDCSIKVAILSISDCYNILLAPQGAQLLLERLRKFHQIQLIADYHDLDIKDFLQVRHVLSGQGLNVGHQLFCETVSSIDQLAKTVPQLMANPRYHYQYSHITTRLNRELVDQLTYQEIVVTGLNNEILRLRSKYNNNNEIVSERIRLIQNMLGEVDVNVNQSGVIKWYRMEVVNHLEQLQRKMESTNSIACGLQKMGLFRECHVTGKEEIELIKRKFSQAQDSLSKNQIKIQSRKISST